jgi:flavin-dependent dehydrogenase
MRRTPLLIAGGGPAGAAAAIVLAKAGHAPELFERSAAPHDNVCGGFLSADTLASLLSLGIDPLQLGAKPISALRLVNGERQVLVALPFAAAGLSRRTLDAALLEAAVGAGATVRRGMSVRMAYPSSRSLRTQDDDLIFYDALFVATGKHDLRGAPRPRLESSRLSVGLRARLPRSPERERALSEVVELHLFDEGYAGLLLEEDGSSNLCISVSAARFARAGGVTALVDAILAEAPLLRERMATDVPAHWQAIAGVPYGWKSKRTDTGIFRLGDQAGVIASLAGDGLGLALASGLSAGRAFLAGGPTASIRWQQRFRRRLQIPLALGEMLRRAVGRPLPRRLMMALAATVPDAGPLAARATRIPYLDG